MEATKRNGLIATASILIVGLILITKTQYSHIEEWWKAHQTERFQQLMLEARERMEGQHWQEAKHLFEQAGDIDPNSVPALIGYSYAVFQLDGAQSALNALSDCTHESCNSERNKIHLQAFQKIIISGVSTDRVEEIWGHASKVFSPLCAVEQIMIPDMALATWRRDEFNKALGAYLERNVKETQEELSARGLIRTTQLVRKLEENSRGKVFYREPGVGFNCDTLEKRWERDRNTIQLALATESTSSSVNVDSIENSDSTSGIDRNSDTGNYLHRLHQLYDLRAAMALIDLLDARGKKRNVLPWAERGPEPDELTITNPRWEPFRQEPDGDSERVTYVDDRITLKVDVTGAPNGSPIIMKVFDTSVSPAVLVARIRGKVQDGIGTAFWDVRLNRVDSKLEFEGEAWSMSSKRAAIQTKLREFIFSF